MGATAADAPSEAGAGLAAVVKSRREEEQTKRADRAGAEVAEGVH